MFVRNWDLWNAALLVGDKQLRAFGDVPFPHSFSPVQHATEKRTSQFAVVRAKLCSPSAQCLAVKSSLVYAGVRSVVKVLQPYASLRVRRRG